MKRETVNYFAVGLFVLAGLGLLLLVLFHRLSGAGDQDTYYTRYRNVAGVSPGTRVTYEGYTLGRVVAVRPRRDAAGTVYDVELDVQRGWQIPADSVARIGAEGVLADTVIDIAEGRARQFVNVGGVIRGERAADIGMLGEQARVLLENLNGSVQRVDATLDGRLPAVLDGVQHLVTRLDASATHLSGMLNADTEAQTRRVLDNLEGASVDFRNLTGGLADVRQETQQLVRRLDSLVASSQPDVQQATAELRRLLEQVSRYSDGILENLDSASRNMNEFSRQIRENPGRLLVGASPRDRSGPRE
jgi:phospholipid/cholesterol/gamma-HCH transport system substrate-binding protein